MDDEILMSAAGAEPEPEPVQAEEEPPTPDELICPICGAGPFKSKAGRIGHNQKHVAESFRPDEQPVILQSWRPVQNPYYGQRSIKMLRPVCRICQDQDNVPFGWWTDCPHDPYITLAERKEQVPVYEDILKGGNHPTGRKRVVRMETQVFYEPTPNRVDVALTAKINGGKGVLMGRGKGFIMPSELRSPHFPYGIADACEYHDCYEQEGLKQYGRDEYIGTFHTLKEAELVWHDVRGKTLEIGYDDNSRRRRAEQLEAARV